MNFNTMDLENFLNSQNIFFLKNFDLKTKSWIKSGGLIKSFIKPKNLNEIKIILKFLKIKKINFYVIGNISNTIIRDGEVITPFINLSLLNKIKQLKNNKGLHFFAGSGVPIPVLSKYVNNRGYSGTEGLFGIPGSVGGGIYMNASSFEDSLTKYIHKIVSIDTNNNIIITKRGDANFSWRFSKFHNNKNLIIGAYFYFPKNKISNKKLLENKLQKHLETRKKLQEKEYPNLGSLFATKNIYSDLKFISPTFLALYILNKLINLIFFKNFFNKYLFRMRVFVNSLYLKKLNLDYNSNFTLSEKTINCLVNKGSEKSIEGIDLIKQFKKKIKNKIKLENIILDKIL